MRYGWVSLLVVALCVRVAGASELVAVLPLDVRFAKLDAASRMMLEEEVRTVAGNVLTPLGFTVLTGETTLRILQDNGLDPDKCAEGACALDTAREMNAKLFLSGSVATAEGRHAAFVRLFQADSGRQLASIRIDGTSIWELRSSFESKAGALFSSVARGGATPALGPVAPPPASSAGPVIKSGKRTKAIGDLTIDAKPRDAVRLDVTDPRGKTTASAPPYRDSDAVPGKWKVLARAAGYEDEERSFEVLADEVTLVKVELKQVGGLTITGKPEGAAVTVTGPAGFNHEGGLPWEASGLRSGTYRVSVSRPSYATHEQDVSVANGETALVNVELVRAKESSTFRVAPHVLKVHGQFLVTGRTVRDTGTGLEWQREIEERGHVWSDAKAYCSGLELDGIGWRLPTHYELLTIVDRSSRPAIDGAVFPGTPQTHFWSSSPRDAGRKYMRTVGFAEGDVGQYLASYPRAVRCVR